MIIYTIPFQQYTYAEDYANHPEHDYDRKIIHYNQTGSHKTKEQLIEENLKGILGEYAVCQYLHEKMNYPLIRPDLSVRRIASHNDDLFNISVKTSSTNLRNEWSDKTWMFAQKDIETMEPNKAIVLACVDLNLLKYGVVGWTKKKHLDTFNCWKRAINQNRPAIYESDLLMHNILFQ